MKLSFFAAATFVLGFSSSLHAQLGGLIGGEFTLTNISGTYATGGELGLSYATDYGTHYLIGSAFYLEQDDVDEVRTGFGFGDVDAIGVDATGFGVSYRYGFSFFERFEPFIEYGWDFLSSSFDTTDALGNSVNIDGDSSGDHLTVGIIYQLHKDVYLKGSFSFHGITTDLSTTTPGGDALGNLFGDRERLQTSASLGITLKF